MEQVQVASPDGKVKFTLLPNAERLTYTVTMGDTTVIEPSPVVMRLDGFDLSAGVVFGAAETFQINETYPWHGVKSTAVNQCNGARIPLEHDLSSTAYTLEVRVFNDGVAFRHVIPGAERRVARSGRVLHLHGPKRLHGLVPRHGRPLRSPLTKRRTSPRSSLEHGPARP